jgi:hypothetical protein
MGAYSQVQIPMRPQQQQTPPSHQQNMTASAVLYYSNYCSICNNLLRMIASRNLKSFFALVCVDQNSDRRRVPDFVKSVPMAYISGRATGGEPKLLSEGALLEYIEHCAAAAQRQPQQQQQQQYQSSTQQQNQDMDPASCAGGDAYSFLNDNDGKPGDGLPGRSSGGSLFYELNGNDVDFRIDGAAVESSIPPPTHHLSNAGSDDTRPSFLEPVETRGNNKQMDVSSIEELRRSEDEKWKPPK